MRMRYEIKVINVGGLNIPNQIAKAPNFPAIRYVSK